MQTFTVDMLNDRKELQVVRVPVPEFGDVCCFIGEMDGDEQDSRLGVPWMKRRKRLELEDGDNSGFRAFAVAACLCDENRNWLAKSISDINELCDKMARQSAKAVTRLFAVAAQLNGIGELAIEEIEKN